MALKAPRLKDSDVIVRLARNTAEIAAANHLVCRNYIDEGYWDSDEPFRKNRHMHSDMRAVFVAEKKGRIVGTASIVKDSRDGLPADKAYQAELRRFRNSGERLAEVSSLAVDREYGGQHKNLVIFLFKYLYQYSFYYAHLDRFVVACVARHAPFYKSVYRFEQLTGEAPNSYVKDDVRLVLLTLPLLKAHKWYFEQYEVGLDDIRDSYYRFMLVDEHPNLEFPDKALMQRPREIDWVAQATLQDLPLAV